jgi:hypothetical protein
MNTNSFIKHNRLLPISVISVKNEINYYFEQDVEDYVIPFLNTEMPGIIVGENDKDIISVVSEDENIRGYQGQVYSEYYEQIDSDRSIGSIKEIFCVNNQYDFYRFLFKFRSYFATSVMKQLGIMTLEEIFYNEFKSKGFEKVAISIYMTSDGFNESEILFKNSGGNEIKVIYPEFDYCEGNDYNYLNRETSPNWFSFFKAIKRGNVMNYEDL